MNATVKRRAKQREAEKKKSERVAINPVKSKKSEQEEVELNPNVSIMLRYMVTSDFSSNTSSYGPALSTNFENPRAQIPIRINSSSTLLLATL